MTTVNRQQGAAGRGLVIDVFPMMQTGMGYWWAVHDENGHILKLGNKPTEVEAVEAACAWERQATMKAVQP